MTVHFQWTLPMLTTTGCCCHCGNASSWSLILPALLLSPNDGPGRASHAPSSLRGISQKTSSLNFLMKLGHHARMGGFLQTIQGLLGDDGLDKAFKTAYNSSLLQCSKHRLQVPHYSSSYSRAMFFPSHQCTVSAPSSQLLNPDSQVILPTWNYSSSFLPFYMLDLSSKVIWRQYYQCWCRWTEVHGGVGGRKSSAQDSSCSHQWAAAGMMHVWYPWSEWNAWVAQMDQRWALHTVPRLLQQLSVY